MLAVLWTENQQSLICFCLRKCSLTGGMETKIAHRYPCDTTATTVVTVRRMMSHTVCASIAKTQAWTKNHTRPVEKMRPLPNSFYLSTSSWMSVQGVPYPMERRLDQEKKEAEACRQLVTWVGLLRCATWVTYHLDTVTAYYGLFSLVFSFLVAFCGMVCSERFQVKKDAYVILGV